MVWVLLLLVIGPIVELWVILQVADVIGGWETIALLLFEGLLGSWLIKRQGRAVVSRIDERLRSNELPTKELADGFLILMAGVLMLAPGFLTDIVGFALLFPPTRAVARAGLLRRFKAKMGEGFAFVTGPRFGPGAFGGFGGAAGGADVYDATMRDDPPPPRPGATALGPGEPRR